MGVDRWLAWRVPPHKKKRKVRRTQSTLCVTTRVFMGILFPLFLSSFSLLCTWWHDWLVWMRKREKIADRGDVPLLSAPNLNPEAPPLKLSAFVIQKISTETCPGREMRVSFCDCRPLRVCNIISLPFLIHST